MIMVLYDGYQYYNIKESLLFTFKEYILPSIYHNLFSFASLLLLQQIEC